MSAVRRGGDSHLDALDGLRGIAVGLVFFVHYHPWIEPYLRTETVRTLSARIADTGNLGVDVFFVLSGYLIYGGLLRRPQPLSAFLQRRIQRLYPTFLVVFLPVLLMEIARGAPNLSAGAGPIVNLVGNLTLLAGFVPVDPLIVVAWTLSWELAFYIVTPLMFRFGRFSERSPGQRLVMMSLAWGAVSLPGLLRNFGNARMLMFLGGVVIAEWSLGSRRPAWSQRGALAGAVALVTCFSLAVRAPLATSTLGVLEVVRDPHSSDHLIRVGVLLVTLPVVLWTLIGGRSLLSNLMSSASLRWLGLVSYSYYLTHALVIRALGEVAQKLRPPGEGNADLWFMVALPPTVVATLVVAWFLHVTVERPCSIDPVPAVEVLPPRVNRWPWQSRELNARV